MSARPRTSRGSGPPLEMHRTPAARRHGAIRMARRRWFVMNRPTGISANMRAKPNAAAAVPSAKSPNPPARPISGSSTGKGPDREGVSKTNRAEENDRCNAHGLVHTLDEVRRRLMGFLGGRDLHPLDDTTRKLVKSVSE